MNAPSPSDTDSAAATATAAARNYRGSGEINPVDRHLGGQLWRFRVERGWSQGELGRRLGVSFQQVQKYEKASNNLSAGRLHAAALAFGRPLGDFFEGFDGAAAPAAASLETKAAVIALRHYHAIESPDMRELATALLRMLAKIDAARRAGPLAA